MISSQKTCLFESHRYDLRATGRRYFVQMVFVRMLASARADRSFFMVVVLCKVMLRKEFGHRASETMVLFLKIGLYCQEDDKT